MMPHYIAAKKQNCHCSDAFIQAERAAFLVFDPTTTPAGLSANTTDDTVVANNNMTATDIGAQPKGKVKAALGEKQQVNPS